MLRWKIRSMPLLVAVALVVLALANAKGGSSLNWGW